MITSRASRLVLWARMPWSIASCTSSRPITGPAAPRIAITASSATRPRWPRRYIPSRESPVLRCNELVSEESCEPAVTREQLRRRAVLDDAAVEQDDRAVRDLHGREALRRDEHGSSLDRGAQVVDEQALGLRVDRAQGIVEHEHVCARDERARERDALALPAGAVDAALADQRVVAVR